MRQRRAWIPMPCIRRRGTLGLPLAVSNYAPGFQRRRETMPSYAPGQMNCRSEHLSRQCQDRDVRGCTLAAGVIVPVRHPSDGRVSGAPLVRSHS